MPYRDPDDNRAYERRRNRSLTAGDTDKAVRTQRVRPKRRRSHRPSATLYLSSQSLLHGPSPWEESALKSVIAEVWEPSTALTSYKPMTAAIDCPTLSAASSISRSPRWA